MCMRCVCMCVCILEGACVQQALVCKRCGELLVPLQASPDKECSLSWPLPAPFLPLLAPPSASVFSLCLALFLILDCSVLLSGFKSSSPFFLPFLICISGSHHPSSLQPPLPLAPSFFPPPWLPSVRACVCVHT